MKNDIHTTDDIVLLVNSFYDKVQQNKLLATIFNDIAAIHWESHLPRMYDFWGNILLGIGNFKGNPMEKHIALSEIAEMSPVAFQQWLAFWEETVDEHFCGSKAKEAKISARNIANLMQYKIQKHQESLDKF